MHCDTLVRPSGPTQSDDTFSVLRPHVLLVVITSPPQHLYRLCCCTWSNAVDSFVCVSLHHSLHTPGHCTVLLHCSPTLCAFGVNVCSCACPIVGYLHMWFHADQSIPSGCIDFFVTACSFSAEACCVHVHMYVHACLHAGSFLPWFSSSTWQEIWPIIEYPELSL